MKQIFFKSILLCLFTLTGSKSFAFDCKVNGIYYNLLGDEAAVTSSPNKYSGNIVIPDVITFSNKTFQVTRIGGMAFFRCSNLKSVTIPKSVTFIWDNAFVGCINLEKLVVDPENTTYDSRNNCNAIIESSTNKLVVGCKETIIPSGVTRIEKSAFEGCEKLKSITIPEGVTYIADFAFADCPSLESIIFPNSIDSLGNKAFNNSPWAKHYPDGVLYIGKIVYGYKGEISEDTEIEIKEGATTILPNAFEKCVGLSSVTLPNSLTSIGNGAFKFCISLKRITFGDKLKDIGENAFGFCLSLSDADLPNTVTNIGDNAFAYCVNLRSVSLGNSLTVIGPRSFYACQRLDSITLPNSVTAIGYSAFEDCIRLKSVKMFNSVKDLGEAAFRNCKSLLNINLSEKIDIIREGTFLYCNNLTSITIPCGVHTVEKSAFSGCQSLTKLSIPNGLISIGESAFAGCKSLESIFVSKTIKNIGNMAFFGCANLSQIEVDTENAIYDSRNNCNALNFTASNILIVGSEATVIPDDIEGISSFAFAGNTKLKSITIPKGVKSIGNAVFLGCNGLEKIDVEPGNETYDSRDNCNAIVNTSTNTLIYGCKTTMIPKGIVCIGDAAFAGNTSMKSITIPSSVTKFGKAAFNGCNGLEKIVVEEGNSVFDSRDNCNAIIETASNTLINGCKSTVIPESVTKIGNSAFYNFSDLLKLEIPNSVIEIGESAFAGCNNCVFICNSERPATSSLLSFPKTTCIVPEKFDKKYYSFQPGWLNMYYNSGFRLYKVTPTSVTLKGFPAFTDQWVEFEGKRYEPTDNMITIEGLTPNKHYSFETHATLNGTDYSYTIKAETK